MITTPIKVDKLWGYELWLVNDKENNYCGKILHINAGQQFSLHFHKVKDESWYILNNKVLFSYIDTKVGKLIDVWVEPGNCIEINRGLPHALKAGGEAVDIIETSTYHTDEDSYRITRDVEKLRD